MSPRLTTKGDPSPTMRITESSAHHALKHTQPIWATFGTLCWMSAGTTFWSLEGLPPERLATPTYTLAEYLSSSGGAGNVDAPIGMTRLGQSRQLTIFRESGISWTKTGKCVKNARSAMSARSRYTDPIAANAGSAPLTLAACAPRASTVDISIIAHAHSSGRLDGMRRKADISSLETSMTLRPKTDHMVVNDLIHWLEAMGFAHLACAMVELQALRKIIFGTTCHPLRQGSPSPLSRARSYWRNSLRIPGKESKIGERVAYFLKPRKHLAKLATILRSV